MEALVSLLFYLILYPSNIFMLSFPKGYVLSKEAVKRFVEIGLDDEKHCRHDAGGAEDVEMGNWFYLD